MDAKRLDKLRRRLGSSWPLLGGWLRRRAARALTADGSPEALSVLAEALANHAAPAVRRLARESLARSDTPACVDAVARAWAASRHPELEALLTTRGQLPSGPPPVRRLAALKLGRLDDLSATGPDGVPDLIAACRDPDPVIRASARTALARLSHPAGVQALCDTWARERNPVLEEILVGARLVAPAHPARLLTALKVGRREEVADLSPGDVLHLLAALEDADETIATGAEQLVDELRSADTRAALVDPLCARWAQTRAPRLEALVVRGRLVASDPPEVRVLSALKTDQPELLVAEGAEEVEPLVKACADPDPEIAGRAPAVLRKLAHPGARQAVCRVFLERGDERARDSALEGGYLPDEPHERALFLFLTEQWERYAEFDFDRRLLLGVLETAGPALRQRVVDKLRAAGRTDFLAALAGADYRSRVGTMSPDEVAFLVGMLADKSEWEKLWALAVELPLPASVRVVRILAGQGWRPGRADDRAAFARLAGLAADPKLSEDVLGRQLPPAALRAKARVPGRVNDVAFSPARPLIAIGTGRRKVVLWDYQKGEVQEVLGGFEHSVGRVAFTPDDTLLCSERAREGDTRQLHCWRAGGHLTRTYRGEVTAIEPVSGGQALLTFRDARVALLDPWAGEVVKERVFRSWCRGARVSPDSTRAALLHHGVSLVSLPDLDLVARTDRRQFRQVVLSACFVPGGDELLVGRYEGQLLPCRRQDDLLVPGPPLARHRREVVGVELLRDHAVVLTACADGHLRFVARASGAVLGEVRVGGERLTSLHVTPGGEFMVVGDSDASMSLWDLRVLELPELLARPLARAVPLHLAGVQALADQAGLPPGVVAALRYLRAALEHRFRHDVEVDEVVTIRAGEFDIEVEG